MSSYLPREHGTYAELAFPLLSGLLLAPSPAGVAYAAACVAVFMAYEPAALLLGIRGVRLRAQLGEGARTRLFLWTGGAALAAVAAVVLSPPAALWLALVPLVFAVLAAGAIAARRIRTVAGELAVAGALSAMYLPVAGAVGRSGAWLWGPAAVWLVAFALATLAVHALKDGFKGRARWTLVAAPLAGPAVGLAAVVLALLGRARPFAVAVIPPVVAVVGVLAARVHPRHLKRVGWTLVAAYTVSLGVMLAWGL